MYYEMNCDIRKIHVEVLASNITVILAITNIKAAREFTVLWEQMTEGPHAGCDFSEEDTSARVLKYM